MFIIGSLEKEEPNLLSERANEAYRNLLSDTKELFEVDAKEIMNLKSDDLGKIVKDSQKKRLDRLYKAEVDSAIKNSIGSRSEVNSEQHYSPQNEDKYPNGRDLFKKIAEQDLIDEFTKSEKDKSSASGLINYHTETPHDFKENSTTMFDEIESNNVVRSVGSYLYQDFKNRVQRQKLVQENLEKEMLKKMNQSKVNKKSRELVIK